MPDETTPDPDELIRVNISMPRRVHQKLGRIALDKGRSRSNIVARLIDAQPEPK